MTNKSKPDPIATCTTTVTTTHSEADAVVSFSASVTITPLARELFEEEWELSRRPFASAKHAALRRAGVRAEECPLHWLPRLFEAVTEHDGDERSLDACEPMIRRLLDELAGVEARASAMRDPIQRAAMDEYARHITVILERVRTRARAAGSWPAVRAAG